MNAEVKERLSEYSTIEVHGKTHILRKTNRLMRDDGFKNANYRNTGRALCGILPTNQTLFSWVEAKILREKTSTPLVPTKKRAELQSV